MRIRAFVVLALLVGCTDPDEGDDLDTSTAAVSAVATATSPADSLGSDNSRFFPIGMFTDTGVRTLGPGYPTVYPYLQPLFMEEVLGQYRGWGVNLLTNLNVDTTTANALFDTTLALGGMNNLFSPVGPAVTSVADTVTKFGTKPTLLAYYFADEPLPTCQPGQECMTGDRVTSDAYGALDPAHGIFSTTYDFNVWSKQLAVLGSNLMSFDVYPLGTTTPFNPSSYESVLDSVWQHTPLDQAYSKTIQAFGDLSDPDPNGPHWPLPTAAQERLLTWLALGYGARGALWFMPRDPNATTIQSIDYDGNLLEGAGAALPGLVARMKAIAPYLVDAVRDDPNRYNGPGGEGCGTPGPSFPVYAFVYPVAAGACTLHSFTRSNGEKDLILVNKQTTAATYTVQIKAGFITTANGTPVLSDPSGGVTQLTLSGSNYTANVSLGPLDGTFLRVLYPYDAQIELVREKSVHAVKMGQPINLTATVTNTGSSNWPGPGVSFGYRVYLPNQISPVTSTLAGPVAPIAVGQQTTINVSIPTGSGTSIVSNGSMRIEIFLSTSTVAFPAKPMSTTAFVHDVVFVYDTFDQPAFKPPAEAWGRWARTPLARFREGAMVLDGGGAMIAQTAPITAGVLEADLQIDPLDQSTHAGWVVHAQPNGNGYVFRLSSTGLLERFLLQGGSLVAKGSVTIPAIAPGTWVHVMQTFGAGNFATYLNYSVNPVDVFSDATYTSGNVGLWAGDGDGGVTVYPDHMHADNFVVSYDGHATALPVAPTGLRFSQVGGQMQLDWDVQSKTDLQQIMQYRIWGTEPSHPTTLGPLAVVTHPPYRATVAAGAQTYAIAAFSVAGIEGPRSATVAGSTASGPTAAPTGLTASATSMRSVALSWSAVTGADHYDVFRVPAGITTFPETAKIKSLSATAYEDAPAGIYTTDLQEQPRPNTGYTYAVAAVDGFGQRGPFATASTTTGGSTLASGFGPGWNRVSGNWIPTGNGVTQTMTTVCGTGYILRNNNNGDPMQWQDFVIDTRLGVNTIGGGNAAAGVSFGQSGAPGPNGFTVTLSATSGLLQVLQGAGVVAQTTLSTSVALPPSVTRNLRIERRGGHLGIFVDGVKELDLFGAQYAMNGFLGLYTCSVGASFQSWNVLQRERWYDLEGTTAFGSGSAQAQFQQLVMSGQEHVVPGEIFVHDFIADTVVALDGGTGWAGVTFRKAHDSDTYLQSGYAVYLRMDGVLVLARGATILGQVGLGVTQAHIRVRAVGPQIVVTANGQKIMANDSTYTSGTIDLMVQDALARFDTLIID